MAEKDAHRFFQQLIAAVVSEANLCVDVTLLHQFLLLLNSQSHLFRNISTALASPTET